MTTALILFLLTYVLMLLLPKYRTYVVLASAGIFLLLQILSLKEAWFALDWNVILMIAGTMGLVAMFIESNMPMLLADQLIRKASNTKWCVIYLAIFAGLISAFVDNVATVIMIAPIALTMAKRLKISPVPMIITIAIFSNLEGAATLVGDTTSILLGKEMGLNFFDFFWYAGRPGMFFVIQLGLIAAVFVLLWIFRHDKIELQQLEDKPVVKDYVPSVLLIAMIFLLIGASFLPDSLKFNEINGVICVSLMIIGLLIRVLQTKKFDSIKSVVKEIDYLTLLLLAGLFVVIKGIESAGVITKIGDILSNVGGGNPFIIFTIIVWASVLLSAFVDNIPYVLTMLTVVGTISTNIGIDPTVLYFGLVCGATLGGNITPIGASANIAGIGILRKAGYEVKLGEYLRYSIPITIAAVTIGYLLIWVLWGM